jgi:nitroreductase
METMSTIFTRKSAVKLREPAPTREQLEKILRAGVQAPDHGRLAPWRFVVMEGDARLRLGAAMAECKRCQRPDAKDGELDREQAKALRAPTIIAVAARPDLSGKIPEIEQVMSAAAAVQNMWLAAHALGIGAMWKTGDAAYDDGVKAAIGLEASDRIVAFLYLGERVGEVPQRETDAAALTTWL